MPAKSPRALVCMDFDGVPNSALHGSREGLQGVSALRLGETLDMPGEDAVYVSGGRDSAASTRFSNTRLLKSFFRILDNNDVLVVPGSQRFFMPGEYAEAPKLALDAIFGQDRSFMTPAQIAAVQASGLNPDELTKGPLVRWMHQQYGKGVPFDRVFLVDDNLKYFEKTAEGYSCKGYEGEKKGEKGEKARGIYASHSESYPKDGPTKYFWMADVLLQTVPPENLIKEIAQCDEQTREEFLELLEQRAPEISAAVQKEVQLEGLLQMPHEALVQELAQNRQTRETFLPILEERDPGLERAVQNQRMKNASPIFGLLMGVSVVAAATYLAVRTEGFSELSSLGFAGIAAGMAALIGMGIIAAVGKWNQSKAESSSEAVEVDNLDDDMTRDEETSVSSELHS